MGAHEYITNYRARLGRQIESADTPEGMVRAMDPFEAFAGFEAHGRPVGAAGGRKAWMSAGPQAMLDQGPQRQQFAANDASAYQDPNRYWKSLRVSSDFGANVSAQMATT
jgi:hypothetical protein